MKSLTVASAIACAMLLGTGSAFAAVGDTAGTTVEADYAACSKLPVSERGLCKAEQSRRADASANNMPGAVPVAPTTPSRYGQLVTECSHAPSSEQNSCVDAASLGEARPAQNPNR
ncbi:MAG TPA: hypothetical protein VJ891_03350 [Casimicrobiaceae bacterium]|nr:hypothetical protein [Casimicrobiaceae bacterium]